MKRKLTVNQFALSSLKHRKKQYSVLFIGIILAMVFSSAVPFFISCAKASQKEMHNRQLGNQDLLVINSMTLHTIVNFRLFCPYCLLFCLALVLPISFTPT